MWDHVLLTASKAWEIYCPMRRRLLSSVAAIMESHLYSFVVTMFLLSKVEADKLLYLVMAAMYPPLYSMSAKVVFEEKFLGRC